MEMTLDALVATVLNLSSADRSHLLDRLISSLDQDAEVLAAWDQVAKRRHEEIKSGAVTMISAETVFAELHAELQ